MNGGLIIAGQLVTRLDFPMEVGYLHATRYRNKLTGGELFWKARAEHSLVDRTVLIIDDCLLYTSPSPRDRQKSRMPSSA